MVDYRPSLLLRRPIILTAAVDLMKGNVQVSVAAYTEFSLADSVGGLMLAMDQKGAVCQTLNTFGTKHLDAVAPASCLLLDHEVD